MIVITLYITYTFLATIHLYRYCLRPFIGVSCVMYPSCSEYGYIAIKKHGAWVGGIMALKRIGRCHPHQKKLVDFVPD